MRQVRGDGDGHAKRTDATKARQEQRDMRADVAPVRINSESPIPAYTSAIVDNMILAFDHRNLGYSKGRWNKPSCNRIRGMD